MYLITAYQKKCTECAGVGRRTDEDFPCPTCSGSTFEPVASVVDGRLYRLFPDEILEIEDKNHAAAILHHKAFQGVIELKPVRTENGFEINKKGALEISRERIARFNKEAAAEYIRLQQEGPLAAGKPAQPPTGKYKEAVEAMNIDLAQHGIRPVGSALQASETRDRELAELKEQVANLTRLLLSQQAQQSPQAPPAERKAKNSPKAAVAA